MIKKNRHIKLINRIIILLFYLRNILTVIIFYCLRIFKIKNNKIIISSYQGNDFIGNPKYIANELLRVSQNKLDIVWVLKKTMVKNNTVPKEIRIVKDRSLKFLYEIVTARIWIDNVRKRSYVRKRKGQFYIQTWHGTPIKKIEKDAENNLPLIYVNNAKRDSKNIDILISNSTFLTNIFKQSFWYNGEIKETGSPRNDFLTKECVFNKKQLKKSLDLENKQIILFAPTFRKDIDKNGIPQVIAVNPTKILNVLEEKYSKEFVFLIKFHPNVTSFSINEVINNDKRIIVASKNSDIQKLMCISDMLITDYSSIIFDYIILRKPIVLFLNDYEEYNSERGFYLNLEKLNLPITYSNNEVCELLQGGLLNNFIENIDNLTKMFGIKEKGTASKQIVKKILTIIDNNK